MSELFAAFGIDWKLLIVQAINFALLLTLLTYLLYKPILRLIDERREKVAEGVRKAQAADAALADAKVTGEQMVGDAARESEAMVAAARARADEKGVEIVRTAEQRAAALVKEAEARAEEAQRLALSESEKQIARAAMLAAEKILREKAA